MLSVGEDSNLMLGVVAIVLYVCVCRIELKKCGVYTFLTDWGALWFVEVGRDGSRESTQ
jgi:hypothetical protein